MDHRINVDNLKILLGFLEENYDKVQQHLDMNEFCSFGAEFYSPNPSAVLEQYPDKIEDCGTTLCLAGWAAIVPDFQAVVKHTHSFTNLIDNLFSHRGWVFAYLFGGDWTDDLDAGLDRIRCLIAAVEAQDEVFLHYLAEYADNIQEVHGKEEDDWKWSVEDIEFVDTRQEAKDYFPVYSTPNWFLESAQ